METRAPSIPVHIQGILERGGLTRPHFLAEVDFSIDGVAQLLCWALDGTSRELDVGVRFGENSLPSPLDVESTLPIWHNHLSSLTIPPCIATLRSVNHEVQSKSMRFSPVSIHVETSRGRASPEEPVVGFVLPAAEIFDSGQIVPCFEGSDLER